jgi:hypothetical protein
MSKKRQKLDKRQMMLDFSFEQRVEAHLAAKADRWRGFRLRPQRVPPQRLRNKLSFKACERRGARRTSSTPQRQRREA